MSVLYTLLAGLLLLLFLLRQRFPFLWQDARFILTAMGHTMAYERKAKRKPNFTFLETFKEQVQRFPRKPFLVYEGETYTYSRMDRLSNQAARALLEHSGLVPGGCAAVFMGNSPAYVWIWLALCKIGCSMACLNYNIRGKFLLHCFNCSGANVLISSADLIAAVEGIEPSLSEKVKIFSLSTESTAPRVQSLLDKVEASSDQPLPDSLLSGVTDKSIAAYIFTSGTTGLPKAVNINHRMVCIASSMLAMCGATSNDIIYTPLPLYHISAFLLGLHGCLALGATCVLRSKFSASHFWEDCRKYRVTVIQYVGETLRYLCNTPERPNDRDHIVRLAVGNGLRPEVWTEFLRRFGPIHIYEFYGATEGITGLLNYTRKVGAIGRVNVFHKMLAPYELVQYDVDKDEPVRDASGRCIKVPRGETGLFVSKITKHSKFRGYAGDKRSTEKKILKDVFSKGDLYFNSGDLLMFDQEGFVFFQDRVGDTFRWKGENVSTREVEAALAGYDIVEEANVYGVSVPGHEGRIGMASIQLKVGQCFDGKKMYDHVRDCLPRYAAPQFIRLQGEIETTGTYKQRKGNLVKEGFDPTVIKDPLYYMDDKGACYVSMTQDIFDSIQQRRVKL
ncbi:long-chain fatty acid transport protein 2-like [Ambystoma mexicanum]|uniref:long-chain fatty acid transport protein 2-like n=1 Tax=Ambystoma mexicanum TaxID=8296 RepID=UPI0037E7E49F